MPTQRMAFAAPYQAETPIGQALLNISKAFFGGPGPAQQEAARVAAEENRMDIETKRRKLEGQNALGANMDRAGDFARYAPGNARDPNDPNWDVKAAAAKNFYNNVPAYLAGDALRSGVDVGQAANARVLAYSSPLINDSMRTDAAIGAGKVLQPFSAFSEKGQLAAEGRETASKTRVATSAAAAANPDKYWKVDAWNKITAGDKTGVDARRIAGVDPAPTTEMQNTRYQARATGLTETEQTQMNQIRQTMDMFIRQAPNPRAGMAAFEAAHPDAAKFYRETQNRVLQYQSRPPVAGVQMIGGQPYVPSSLVRGGLVPVQRGDDGYWYKKEADGSTHRLDGRDY